VTLFAVEDLRSAASQTARPVTFVLANDLAVGGVTSAEAGAKAADEVSSPESTRLSLEDVHLKIGDTDVPLRSTPNKGGGGALDFDWVEDTGRIALVLYVARDVMLAPAR